MRELFENDLREFYRSFDAAYDPVPGLARVRAHAPARRRGQRMWAVLAAGTSALTAGGATAVLLLSSGASVAFAGWTPVPTTPTAAALASAVAQCRKLAQPLDPALRNTVGRSRAAQCDGNPILTDARGKYVSLIYAENGQMSELVTGGRIGTSGFEGPIPANPAPDRLTAPAMAVPNASLEGSPATRLKRELSQLQALAVELRGYRGSVSLLVLQKFHFAGLAQQVQGNTDAQAIAAVRRRIVSISARRPKLTDRQNPQLAYAFGRAGSDVSAVSFKFANGKTVRATVEHSWYFAWWPWASSPLTARIVTSSGTTVIPIRH
jgi:hypothetical protein